MYVCGRKMREKEKFSLKKSFYHVLWISRVFRGAQPMNYVHAVGGGKIKYKFNWLLESCVVQIPWNRENYEKHFSASHYFVNRKTFT